MSGKHFSAAPLFGAGLALVLGVTSAAAQSSPAQPSTSSQSAWTAGPGASAGNTYEGFVDAPTQGATVAPGSTFNVGGWFVDTTAQGWAGADQVQVYLGQMGSGGTQLAQGSVAQARPDVGSVTGNPYWTASGFDVQVPTTSLPGGNQTLDVYLHTPGNGWWYEPVTIDVSGQATPASAPAAGATAQSPAASSAATGAPQVSVTSPSENQNVLTSGDFTITGTATEPGPGPSDIDHIEVWIGGERNSGTLLGDVTPLSDGSWSLAFTPTKFPSTHANIYVYAHSRSTGQETETVRGFNITDHT
jgi:hypothetical protein